MASVSIAEFTFMLVVATATAYPVHKEKMVNQDLIKAIRYLWNEKMRKDQYAEAMEQDQNAMRDDDEDRDKENKDDKDRDGDGKGDKNETVNYLCNEEIEKKKDKDEGSNCLSNA